MLACGYLYTNMIYFFWPEKLEANGGNNAGRLKSCTSALA
jgi:hypothetical protein